MSNVLNQSLLGSLLLAVTAILSAEERTSAKIELIIFSQNDESMFERLTQLSDTSRDLLPPAVQLFAPSTDSISHREIKLSDDYALADEHSKIEKDDELEFLYRVAWLQPRYEDNEAVYVSLLPERQGNLLEGVARLSYSKLYRLELSFRYDSSSNTFTEQNEPENRESILINMKKIAIDDKVYYFDHPLIGVLMRIAEIKTEDEPEPGSEPVPEPESESVIQ